MATPDYDNVVAGPAKLTLDDTDVGHTTGGISCNVSPQNRARNVDKFGNSEVAFIHQGDEVRLNCPFSEWAADTLKNAYNAGNDQTGAGGATYMGLGRTSGFIYTDKEAKIIPLLTADAAKLILMHRATPIGDFELPFNADDDRIFEVEFACMVDESQTDGELIGKIQLTAA